MAIPLHLLKLTDGRAPGFGVYAPPKRKKTLAAATLPSPVLVLDLDGGAGSLLPWTARSRKWDSNTPTVYTQEDRQAAFDLLEPEIMAVSPFKTPAPRVDVIYFDPMNPDAYESFQRSVAEFRYDYYNSLVLDPLQEFSLLFQTFSKKQSGVPIDKIMQTTMKDRTGLWDGVQERAMMTFKTLRNYRDMGVFLYVTAGEEIDKDYITAPWGQEKGQKEQAYAIKGTFWVPGKLVNVVGHAVDVIMHGKSKQTLLPTGESVSDAVWITRPEPFEGGSKATWDGGDRWGRLPYVVKPHFQTILGHMYGKEGAKAIYEYAKPIQ